MEIIYSNGVYIVQHEDCICIDPDLSKAKLELAKTYTAIRQNNEERKFHLNLERWYKKCEEVSSKRRNEND